MLLASALLAVAQGFPQLVAVIRHAGFAAAAGHREGLPPLPAWAGRAERAQLNMLANLLPFAALILTAEVSGLADPETARGAVLFFWVASPTQ